MKLALALQLTLLAYHQIFTRFDFFPFNGARFSKPTERIGEAAFNGLLMGFVPASYLFGWNVLLRYGAPYYSILFACELATWFVPYFFGASPKWQEIYSRIQARTIMVLPRRGDNPTPNLEHLILMALTLVTAIATAVAFSVLPRATPPNRWVVLGIGLVMLYGIAHTHWKRTARIL
ncbi:MAG TPA: hypothetical protein VGL42_00955 [Opitutaceae bacterium]|jgi:hypothetical protein